MKRSTRNFIMSLIFAFVVSGTAYAAVPGKVVIGYQNIPNDEIVSIARGWYEKELGTVVELKQFDSGRDVNTAFVSGAIDLALIGTAPVAVGISTGIEYDVFWIHDVIGSAESLAVKNSSNIENIEGIVGKKIAVPFASTAHYSLLAAIDQAGIDPTKVTIIDLQPQNILAAWKRGDIDGAYVWHPTLASILEDGHVITDSEELAGKGALTADLGVVRREFARTYPDIVTTYLKIQRKAIELYRSKPDEAAAAIAKQLGITEKEALEQTGQLLWLLPAEQTAADYLGTSDAKGKLADTLKSTADFLVKQGSIEKAASLDDFKAALNPKFAEEASK